MKKEIVNLLSKAFDLSEDGKFEEAIQYYDQVLKKDPKNVKALIDKGVTLQNMNKPKNNKITIS